MTAWPNPQNRVKLLVAAGLIVLFAAAVGAFIRLSDVSVVAAMLVAMPTAWVIWVLATVVHRASRKRQRNGEA